MAHLSSPSKHRSQSVMRSPTKGRLSFDTYFHVARRCVKTRLDADLIPELMQALSVIETFRKLAYSTCEIALTYDRVYIEQGTPDPKSIPLAENERECLRNHCEIQTGYRRAYLRILGDLCQLVSFPFGSSVGIHVLIHVVGYLSFVESYNREARERGYIYFSFPSAFCSYEA